MMSRVTRGLPTAAPAAHFRNRVIIHSRFPAALERRGGVLGCYRTPPPPPPPFLLMLLKQG